MLLTYKLSLSDYLAAQHLFYWRKLSSKITIVLNYAIYPIAGLLFLAYYIFSITKHPGEHWAGGFFGAVLVLFCIPLLFQYNLRRCYKKTRVTDGDCHFDFNEENIQTDLPGYSKSTVEWQAVRHYQEGKKTILVYIAPTRFFAIPKRILTPGQRDEFIALLQRKIEPKKI